MGQVWNGTYQVNEIRQWGEGFQSLIVLFQMYFRYQENQLRIQRNLAFVVNPKGNTAGRKGEKRTVTISRSPLKKIKRRH